MFLGKNGFVWWIGIVEYNEDPLNLCRAKVRIFGYHPDFASDKVPTDDLPWATTIVSTNVPDAYSRPELGEWVFGFFLDSGESQEPAILGYIPGIPSPLAVNFGRYTRSQRSFATATANSFSIATQSGHAMKFEETPGAESISLTHKNQNTLLMSANTDIILKHQKGPKLTLNNQGATGRAILEVSNTITLSNTSLTMGCQQINMQACSNGIINIRRGSSTIQMFANGNIQLSAPTGDIIVSGNGGTYSLTQTLSTL